MSDKRQNRNEKLSLIQQWSLAPSNWIGGVERWLPNRIKLLLTLFLCKYAYIKIHIKVDMGSIELIFPTVAQNKCGNWTRWMRDQLRMLL